MKNLLFLIMLPVIMLFSCKEDDPEPAEKRGQIILDIKKQTKDSSGKIGVKPQYATVYVWNAENRNFDVDASGTDVYLGYALDNTSNSFKTSDYGAVGYRMDEKIEPGKYFIFVMLPKSSSRGSLANSYTYFEVKAGEALEMEKIFSHDIESEQTEAWDKNK
ncbi:hypothetical protein [Pontibacter anaerobius]|uniref:Uncharacterized protein n=1 Tax=Pontibacter anaerobius TaxID=2993940 RepID=A0ABT3RJP3_9BACT|nr:hypothetical protein [Pontibacter anaerobius]MCX2741736.1 hypothetical protein [Pontibacter anaerobius]